NTNDTPKPLIGRISREELYEDIASGVSHGRLFVAMVVLSTVVAAAGLMRDSAAVIIGAMVIAPLLGPNMALAFATTLGDRQLMKKALKANALGAGLALAMSVSMGMLISVDPDTPELVARTNVGLTDLALALASGAAGALAFTAGVPATLVGVMVAVALLPPTTTAGIYLGAGAWARAADAGSLFAINVVCVNLAATATFLVQGVRPDTWWEAARAKNATRRALAAWATLLALLTALLVFR
ncbi:MAG: TIGR00341 family protein, partial [Phycisphaerales bacterium]|nr:TIGR00341 family protein [Phycisphaerales bacterium]